MQIIHVVLHWLWTATFALLLITGLAMVGARFGWILQYDIAAADYIHRIAAIVFVMFAVIILVLETWAAVTRQKSHPWSVFNNSWYGQFTLITTVLFTLSGLIIWGSHEFNKASVAFAMYVHEKLTYVVLISLIWHIYQKSHALVWLDRLPEGLSIFTVAGLNNHPWMKSMIWVLASAYFFAAAATLISLGGPAPGEAIVQAFMTGMNRAMNQSLMGLAAEGSATDPANTLSTFLLIGLLAAVLAYWPLYGKGEK